MSCNIREYRKNKKMSQQELSEMSGVSRATISGLETGKITVTTTATLKKIANALNEKVETIFLH